jgi:hypothetical protein
VDVNSYPSTFFHRITFPLLLAQAHDEKTSDDTNKSSLNNDTMTLYKYHIVAMSQKVTTLCVINMIIMVEVNSKTSPDIMIGIRDSNAWTNIT